MAITSEGTANPAFEDQAHADRWRPSESLGWALALGLSFLLFELTADPALAVMVACSKFGWGYVKAGWWLRKRDPLRARGRVCLGFCWTAALMIVGTAGLLLAFLVLIVATLMTVFVRGPFAVPGALLRQAAGGGVLFAIFGILIWPLAWVLVALALRGGVRVWVGPLVLKARRRQAWPPWVVEQAADRYQNLAQPAVKMVSFSLHRTQNLAQPVVKMAGFSLLFPMIFVIPTILLADISAAVKAAISLAALAATIATIYYVGNFLERRVVATSPLECWPPGETAMLEGIDPDLAYLHRPEPPDR